MKHITRAIVLLALLVSASCAYFAIPSTRDVSSFLGSGGEDASVSRPRLGSLPIISWNKDLDGSTTGGDKIVSGLQGHPLPTGTGYLASDGGAWYFTTNTIAPGDAGQFLVTNDAGNLAWSYPHGDVDASAADPGSLKVVALQGNAVSSSTPTSGNTLSWNGTSWLPRALDLAGGSAYITNALPDANQAAQSLSGDVTGTTAASTVVGLTGVAGVVTATATTIKETGASLTFADSGGVARANLDMAHGMLTLGGASDPTASLGPDITYSTDESLWLLGSGVAKSAINWFAQSDGVNNSINVNPSGTGGYLYFRNNNAAALARWEAASFTFFVPLILDANFTGVATTGDLRAENNTTILAARNAANTADLSIIKTDGSDGVTIGGANVTSLTFGTGASTAALNLQGGNAVTGISIIAPGSTAGTATTTITGAVQLTTKTISASTYTVDSATNDYIIITDTTSNAITVTLPAPTNGRVLIFIDKKNTWGTHQVSLARHGSEKINNVAATFSLPPVNGVRSTVWSDGTDWYEQ